MMVMFWSKKEEKKTLPDLPPLKTPLLQTGFTIPSDIPEQEDEADTMEKHGLPSFPDSPIRRSFSQAVIKDAVTNDMEETHSASSEKTFKTVEVGTETFLPPPISTKKQLMNEPRAGEVFVKIDKFNTARKSLLTAQQKINDIDTLLKKIRETRMREEQELSAWEKEIASVKAKIREVSQTIFEKL